MNINLLISVHAGFFCQMVYSEDFITPVSCCLKALARLRDTVTAKHRYASVKLSVKLTESPCSAVHRLEPERGSEVKPLLKDTELSLSINRQAI